jgi:hypothetical protein
VKLLGSTGFATTFLVVGLVALLALPSAAFAGGGRVKTTTSSKASKSFVAKTRATTGRQYFLGGRRVPKIVGKLFSKFSRKRNLVHVDNQKMSKFVEATRKGYLEVVIPANTGHVWFRKGEKLYDFGPKGFRVSGVREITRERYGVLVKLDAKQEKNLQHYLNRLEKTNGSELGSYDFHGDKGFQCVTWLMRHSFGEGNFVKMLGGKAKDATSMPRFSNFMVKRARNVEALIVYNKDGMNKSKLDRKTFDIMSIKELRRVFAKTGRPD